MSEKTNSAIIVACVTDVVNTACRENNVPEICYPWQTETALRDKIQELVIAMTQYRITASRLKEYARLVETATEAQDCNGIQYISRSQHTARPINCVTITLHSSWFETARALLADGDREVRDE